MERPSGGTDEVNLLVDEGLPSMTLPIPAAEKGPPAVTGPPVDTIAMLRESHQIAMDNYRVELEGFRKIPDEEQEAVEASNKRL
jgi:hypothetical protein